MFDKIIKFDDKMNVRVIKKTLTLLTSIEYNNYHQHII